MSNTVLINGDCFDALDKLEDNSIGSVVSDPPYLINFMNKGWDKENNIAGNPELYKKLLTKMKAGGYVALFGHSRTHHRIMVALEEAGFELRDTLTWLYGSGFPKSHNISKALQKKATFEAKKWEGYGTALKPAVEFIVLAQKPREGTFANNVLTHGVGGLNIDGCRINAGEEDFSNVKGRVIKKLTNGRSDEESLSGPEQQLALAKLKELGRFPANLILSHSEACVKIGETEDSYQINKLEKWSGFGEEKRPDYTGTEQTTTVEVYECVGDCPIAMMDEQSGIKKGSGKKTKGSASGGIWNKSTGKPAGDTYGDKGGASRFFYNAKVSKKEREFGCEELEEKTRYRVNAGGLENDPKFAPVQNKNDHPTLKPIALMRWLVRLITPPKETCLDLFMGAGSTGGACAFEERDFIGIERDERYFEIATKRIEAWNKEKENEEN